MSVRAVVVCLLVVLLIPLAAWADFQNGQNASIVIGQSDFNGYCSSNSPPPTQNTTPNATSLTLDTAGHLWVAGDTPRVLRFSPPFSNGMNADLVIGQVNYTSSISSVTQSNFSYGAALNPTGVVVDSSGDLWVSDGGNCRILEFVPSFLNGMNASLVLGQPNFTSSGTYTPTQNTLCSPGDQGNAIAFDASGNLWVADESGSRVLEFKPPFLNDMNASLVIGQAVFTSSNTGCTQNQFDVAPVTLTFDPSGNLWVGDVYDRVLEFVPPFFNGMNASLVIGEPNFTTCNNSYSNPPSCVALAPSQSNICMPDGLAFDALGNLWVSNWEYSRVLEFKPPFSNGMNASSVLGQSVFTSSTTGTPQSQLEGVMGLAFSSGSLWAAQAISAIAFSSRGCRAIRFDNVPSSATDLSALVGPSTSQITLNWTATDNPYGADFFGSYLIQDSTDSATVFSTMTAQIMISTTSVPPLALQSYGLGNLAANTTYYFRLWSANVGLNYSPVSNGTTTSTLSDPVSSTRVYQVFGTSAALNWQALPSAPSSSTSEGYEVDASTASNFTGTIFSSITENVSLSTLSLTGLTYNTSYYFRVGSLNWANVADYVVAGSTLTGVGPPPISPQVSAVYFSSVAVSWGSVNALDGYELDASTTISFSGTLLSSITIDGAATSLALTGLGSNTTYYLRVGSLWNGAANYAQPIPASTSTLAAFPLALAPTNISSTSVTANWGANGNSLTTLYIAQVSTNGFATLNASSSTLNDSAVFAGLVPATLYNFRVEAIGNDGQATPFTLLASTMTLLASPGLASTVFTGVSVSSIAVQWTGGGNPLGMNFIVQISTDNFATLNFSSTTQNLSAVFGTGGAGAALVPDTDYNLRVEASSASNNSAFLLLGSTYTLAEPPTGTSIPLVSSNSIALQWQANGNPAGANYEVWQDTSVLFLTPLMNAAVGNSYIAASLAPSTSYYFKVEAVNGDNIPTAFDLTVSAMTSGPSYVVPSSLDAARVYPNPYKPNGGNPDFGKPYNPGDPTSGVILDQLPPQTMIRIYTLTGRLVTELGPPNTQGVIQWSAKNSIGQDVASGVYFAVLSGPAGKATKKIIVIR